MQYIYDEYIDIYSKRQLCEDFLMLQTMASKLLALLQMLVILRLIEKQVGLFPKNPVVLSNVLKKLFVKR